MLNGEEVALPVSEGDSLALKVEALRMFLESKLGTDPFLKCVSITVTTFEGSEGGPCVGAPVVSRDTTKATKKGQSSLTSPTTNTRAQTRS